MTSIFSNGFILAGNSYPNISTISYQYLGNKVYAAQKVDRIYGVLVSETIIMDNTLVKWNKLSWNGTISSSTKVFLFVKSAASEESLATEKWSAPFQNTINDISSQTGQYLQFMAVMRNDNDNSLPLPRIDQINVSFFSSQGVVRFFSKSFNLGFTPKHLFLTYKASNVTDESIIRFAISDSTTGDVSNYQYINPNVVNNLDPIEFGANTIKFMLEFVGTSETNVTVDEFAVLLGGDSETNLNVP